jgi:hypothetical protein
MTPTIRSSIILTAAASAVVVCLGPVSAARDIERQIDKTFRVSAGSTVAVSIFGGSITVEEGGPNSVQVTLKQRVRGVDSEREADEILNDYTVEAVQIGSRVSLTTKGTRTNRDHWHRGVSFSALLSVPPDVTLDLRTSGGSITVHGNRTASVDARTSGGSIRADGGRAAMTLNTSGGGITVREALTDLLAETSGGSIEVGRVGASARDVTLDTSGGSIHVGVDPMAKLTLRASTSGGRVSVLNLPFESSRSSDRPRSQERGTINGGGSGRLTASTSGGSIEIRGLR